MVCAPVGDLSHPCSEQFFWCMLQPLRRLSSDGISSTKNQWAVHQSNSSSSKTEAQRQQAAEQLRNTANFFSDLSNFFNNSSNLPDKSYALGKTAYTPLSTFSYELRTRTEDKPQYVYLSHLGGRRVSSPVCSNYWTIKLHSAVVWERTAIVVSIMMYPISQFNAWRPTMCIVKIVSTVYCTCHMTSCSFKLSSHP